MEERDLLFPDAIRRLFARLAPMVVLTALFIAAPFQEALAQVAPTLGTTESFAVLGGASVVNTGSTVIIGDVGVSPGTVVSGFPPGTETGGTIHRTDGVAGQAQSDNTAAYLNLAGQKTTTDLTGKDLGGQTLVPGVYSFSSTAQLTGPLTLDAGGNSAAVWVFKIGSTLTTASGSSMVLTNGAAPCNVFWQVGSSATLGSTTNFVGNIFALTSITLITGATVEGRLLAQNGSVTMDANQISISACGGGTGTTVPPTINKAFSPATINAGGTSTLTITLSNLNTTAASLSAPFTDTLPSGVVVSASGGTNTCGGALTATAGSSAVTLTGGSIPVNASCILTVDVVAATGGSYINSLAVGALVTSNGSNAAPAVATLTVNALALVAPTLGKAFTPATIAAAGTSTLTITLSNASTIAATLNAPFTDTLPIGVAVSGTASSTCGATPTVATLSGVTTVTLGTGASIPAGGSCAVTVPVTASSGGNYINSLLAGTLQTNNGSNAAPAVATLTVNASTLVAPTVSKVFDPATINAGGSATLTITLSNAGTTIDTLTSPLTDTLPSGVVVSGSASSTCGVTPTVTTSGVTTVTLGTGASIPAGGSCTVTVSVSASSGGNYINSLAVGALQTNNGSNAAPAIATLTVSTPSGVTLGKAFSPATIYAGGLSTLTITLSNVGATASLTAPLTDTLPTGVVVSGSASTTCVGGTVSTTGGATATRTVLNTQPLARQPRMRTIAFRMPAKTLAWLTVGTSTVTLTGGTIPAGGSCTVTVPVTAPVAGNYFNALAAGALQTNNGNNAAPAIATLTVLPVSPAPTLSKSFTPASILAGGNSTLTITLTNPNNAIANLTATLTDTLPSGVFVAGSVSSTCIAPPPTGVNTQQPTRQPRIETIAFRMPARVRAWLSAGTSTVSMAGGSIPAASSCTLTVPVTAPAAGSYINTLPIGALQTNFGSNTTTGAATLVVGTITANVTPGTSATIAVGSSANFTLSLASTKGVSGLVAFGCAGIPTTLNCTFNPPQVTVPASGPATTTLTVAVSAKPSSASVPNGPPDFWPNPSALQMVIAALSFLMIPVITAYSRKDVNLAVLTRWLPALALVLVLAIGLVSCGGGTTIGSAGSSGAISGGSGNTSGSGGTSGGGMSGSSNPVTTQFTVQAQSGSVAVDLSTLTVTVP